MDEIPLTRVTPEQFLTFMQVVSNLQPATRSQLGTYLNYGDVTTEAAATFGAWYGLLTEDDSGNLRVSTEGERLLAYSGEVQKDFIIHSLVLASKEPFSTLAKELRRKTTMSVFEIGQLLQSAFHKSWSESTARLFGSVYSKWLEYLRIAKLEKNSVQYVLGKVTTIELLQIPKANQLVERNVYDFLTENFHTASNIRDEPQALLEKTESDLPRRGDWFRDFAVSAFRRFGFSTRTRDGPREARINMTFQRAGGGDLGLFLHFPIHGEKTWYGFAIATELKAEKDAVGSKAIGQARNLAAKIRETFPMYIVSTLVLSRSEVGFDRTAKEQAPPEVVHLTSRDLIDLLNVQKERLQNGESLLSPMDFLNLFQHLIKTGNLDPKAGDVLSWSKAQQEIV